MFSLLVLCVLFTEVSGLSTIPVELTKHIVLSKLASVSDPIGVATAVSVKAKIAMQDLWQ